MEEEGEGERGDLGVEREREGERGTENLSQAVQMVSMYAGSTKPHH